MSAVANISIFPTALLPSNSCILAFAPKRKETSEQAIQLDPHFAYAYNAKGLAFYSLKRYTEALNALEQAIQFSPNEPTAYYGKGRVLERLQRYQEALQAYEQVIRLDAGYEEARIEKAKVLKRLRRSG